MYVNGWMEHVLLGVQSFNRRLHLLLELHTQPFEAARTRDNVKWEKSSRDANNKATRPFYLYSRRQCVCIERERERACEHRELVREFGLLTRATKRITAPLNATGSKWMFIYNACVYVHFIYLLDVSPDGTPTSQTANCKRAR